MLTYAALAAWYSLVIPLGEAPDEVAHVSVVRYIARHGQLPTTEQETEAVQPPLYYLVGALLTHWIPDHAPFTVLANADLDLSDPLAPRNLLLHPGVEAWPFRGWALAWHLVRLASVALGAVTVWAVFHLGRELLPIRPEIGLGMAALTAFTPQFLYMTAAVNNDNAATATSALVLWQVAALLRRSVLRLPRLAGLGFLLGLGLLSKSNSIALVPMVGLAILLIWWNERSQGAKALVGAGLLTFGVAGLLAGWYYVRNLIVFGDPFGLSFVLASNPVRTDPLTLDVLGWLFRGLARSFWLGWIGIQFDEWIYVGIYVLSLAALLGLGTWLVLRWRQIAVPVRWALAILALHAALTLVSLIRWTAIVRGTDQGRLVYPLLPTVMLILAGGLLIWLPPKARPWGAGALAAAWLALAFITPGRYLAPVYGPPEALDRLPGAVSSLDVHFGDSVRLVGFRLENAQVQPGQKLVLHLYWQAASTPEVDVWARIDLVDAAGAFVMYKDGSPSAGRDTTDRWAPGTIVPSEHRLGVPSSTQPGTYRLTLRLHPPGEPAWLPVTGPQGAPLGDTFTFDVPVKVIGP